MPKLTEEQIKAAQQTASTVEFEEKGGYFYHTDYPNDKYDNRKECWYEAIKKNEEKRLKTEGRDINGQTAQQKKSFEGRKKKSDEIKQKALMAAEMAVQNA